VSWLLFGGLIVKQKVSSLNLIASSEKTMLPSFLEFLSNYPISKAEKLLDQSDAGDLISDGQKSNPTDRIGKKERGFRRWYNLNRVDSVFLESLPRIGPRLAGRICRYRNLLGGFYAAEQLSEVWGIHPDQLLAILPWFHVGEGVDRKLCADTSSWDNLRKHPYIGFEGARIIERYRRHHTLTAVSDLTDGILITDSLYRSWEPYLRICDQHKSGQDKNAKYRGADK
jgi:DNA uptake protein ComE-like DNA-binding protein